ncbi:MAG: hypothetical protein J0I07_00415, partial [Myxococcales bacterium]|nr:hypothetical protein [Myxococcales bacterium]
LALSVALYIVIPVIVAQLARNRLLAAGGQPALEVIRMARGLALEKPRQPREVALFLNIYAYLQTHSTDQVPQDAPTILG